MRGPSLPGAVVALPQPVETPASRQPCHLEQALASLSVRVAARGGPMMLGPMVLQPAGTRPRAIRRRACAVRRRPTGARPRSPTRGPSNVPSNVLSNGLMKVVVQP